MQTVLPSDKPCEHDPIQHVDTGLNGGGQYTLHHTLKAGTSVVLIIDDAQGQEAWSDTVRAFFSSPSAYPKPSFTLLDCCRRLRFYNLSILFDFANLGFSVRIILPPSFDYAN